MTYKIFILRKAQKQLSKIPASDYNKIKQSIQNLSSNPRPPHSQQLKASNVWRLRRGNYRILYEIKDEILIIVVVKIGHRKDIYR